MTFRFSMAPFGTTSIYLWGYVWSSRSRKKPMHERVSSLGGVLFKEHPWHSVETFAGACLLPFCLAIRTFARRVAISNEPERAAFSESYPVNVASDMEITRAVSSTRIVDTRRRFRKYIKAIVGLDISSCLSLESFHRMKKKKKVGCLSFSVS